MCFVLLRHVGTDIPSDLIVQVGDVVFHLHKVAYLFFCRGSVL